MGKPIYGLTYGYPLVMMENHHFQWENPLQITMFNSYVKLPEGKIYGQKLWKTYQKLWKIVGCLGHVFVIFPIILGMLSCQLTHIFQRGRSTTNQYGKSLGRSCDGKAIQATADEDYDSKLAIWVDGAAWRTACAMQCHGCAMWQWLVKFLRIASDFLNVLNEYRIY